MRTYSLIVALIFVSRSYSFTVAHIKSTKTINFKSKVFCPRIQTMTNGNSISNIITTTTQFKLTKSSSRLNNTMKFILSFITILLFNTKKVFAASIETIKGWDLYGRVPNDDWLFNTWRLTDPSFYKRSLAETLKEELPVVLSNFRRRKRIDEIVGMFSGLAVFAVVMTVISFIYKYGMDNYVRKYVRGGSMFGNTISAISKKGPKKGVQIAGMEKGWLDMEQFVEPTPASDSADSDKNKAKKDNKKSSEEEEEEEETEDDDLLKDE